MSVIQTATPLAFSDVFAVNNPLIYQFTADGESGGAFRFYRHINAQTTGGRIAIQIGDVFIGKVGDVIRVKNVGIATIQIATIRAIEVSSFGYLLTTNKSFSGTIEFVESVRNYQIEIRVFQSTGQDALKEIQTHVYVTPDSNGIVRFDASKKLKTFIDLDNILSAGKKNTRDLGVSGKFAVQARERYLGDGLTSEEGWTPSTINNFTYYYASATVQVKNPGGVSLAPYTTKKTSSDFGQFLSAFAEPEYYAGFPNEISFFWVELESSGAANIEFIERKLDQSRAQISTASSLLLNEGKGCINRVLINKHSGAAFVAVTLSIEGVGQEEGYVNTGWVDDDYFETILL